MPKATNISLSAAQKITYLPSNTVMISINEVGHLYALRLDRTSSKILTVEFNDVTAMEIVEGTTLYPITTSTALKIINFIEGNKDKDVIVHCFAGISRSSAVCLFLKECYGYELPNDFWHNARPNKYVLGQLIIARNHPTIII